MSQLPTLPQKLKAVQHYIKTAAEHDQRDPVVAYYCRLFAMQSAMEIDKRSPECKQYLVALMDYLEKAKTANDEEAIHNEVVGQAHLENYALKVFLFADNEDRASRFSKNVVKSFYTAGMLFDTLTVFGEISEDIEKNRKYAKWKAAYIHKCLKNGETPIAGPLGEEEEGADGGGPIGFEAAGPSSNYSNQPGTPSQFQDPANSYQPADYSSGLNLPTNNNQFPNVPQPGVHAPPSTPQDVPVAGKPSPSSSTVTLTTDWTPPKNAVGVSLNPQQYQKAIKYCKFASSALQYEDSNTALDNLTKAMKLLTTGKDS